MDFSESFSNIQVFNFKNAFLVRDIVAKYHEVIALRKTSYQSLGDYEAIVF